MKIKIIVILAALAACTAIAHTWVIRWDLTDDKRYSLSESTRQLARSLDDDVTITLYLDGSLNAGFQRLRKATMELSEELSAINKHIALRTLTDDEVAMRDSILYTHGLTPTLIHERTQDGRTAQTTVWPYAAVSDGTRTTYVLLLHNNRGKSGEENLNESIENLEYAFAEAIYTLQQQQTPKIAFLEGHGELTEREVYDLSCSLARYFQIDRGILGDDATMLNAYKVVIIADPQTPFSEKDKYIIDQYIMQGGRVLWMVNGVQFSQDILSQEGFTPVIPLDIHISDMLFAYGVRINPTLVQDVQCLPIPVDVSADPAQPNYQPMPWYYAPLLLTSQASPISRNLGQVSATFVSHLDGVGSDSIRREVLLATSTASKLIGTPAEVDLSDLNPDMEAFRWQYVPVAMRLEGVFPSAFQFRMPPEGVTSNQPMTKSVPTRQIVIACGSIARNDWQQGAALPVGYDRYSGMSFANRDFLTNAVLYLADNGHLIDLRQKEVALRLINDRVAHQHRTMVQVVSVVLPLLLIAIIGTTVWWIRKRKYIRL